MRGNLNARGSRHTGENRGVIYTHKQGSRHVWTSIHPSMRPSSRVLSVGRRGSCAWTPTPAGGTASPSRRPGPDRPQPAWRTACVGAWLGIFTLKCEYLPAGPYSDGGNGKARLAYSDGKGTAFPQLCTARHSQHYDSSSLCNALIPLCHSDNSSWRGFVCLA